MKWKRKASEGARVCLFFVAEWFVWPKFKIDKKNGDKCPGHKFTMHSDTDLWVHREFGNAN